MTCPTCGRGGQLYPCPCRLGHECPIEAGVCVDCLLVIARNAADRDGDLTYLRREAAQRRARARAADDDSLRDVPHHQRHRTQRAS
jgi:hypothetical protein